MRWFFRIIGFVILAFLSLCVIGLFLPAQQTVSTSIILDADPQDVFDIASDLRSYPEWSGIGGLDSEWVFGGAAEGQGQTAAWRSGGEFGSLEILQTAPDQFVLVSTVGPLGERNVTFALTETDGLTQFLIESERELGGFPYFGRVAGFRQKMKTEDSLKQAAQGLAQLIELPS